MRDMARRRDQQVHKGHLYLRFTTPTLKPRARAQMTLPPTPPTLLNVWGPIQNVWGLIHFVCTGSSQHMHGARSTVLYCAHLAIFMQYTGVFPTISARNSYSRSGGGVLRSRAISMMGPQWRSWEPLATPRSDCVTEGEVIKTRFIYSLSNKNSRKN